MCIFAAPLVPLMGAGIGDLALGAAVGGGMFSGFGGLSTIFSLASSVMGLVGSMNQSNATYQAEMYNRQVAEQNARYAEIRAQDAIERGRIEEQQHRLRVSQIQGQQRVGFGAGGVQVNTGSPLAVVSDTAALGELDALTIRTNADRESFEHKVDAYNFRAQGTAAARTAVNARTAGFIRAGTTVLGAAGTLADRYNQLRAV